MNTAIHTQSLPCAGDRLSKSRRANAFTVDVEDYYHVTAFEGDINREEWPAFESRVVRNTQRLLELLARHDAKATFFVLGWVADEFPELVREIFERGHEIGCHSYWHQLVYRQSPQEFRSDLRKARDVLENAVQAPVLSYRAPSFSITRQALWALEILVEEGFHFDSSVFPIMHDRCGIPGARRTIHRIDTPSGPLWEFPPTVTRLAFMNLPVGGGGYFRLYPYRLTQCCLTMTKRQTDRPFMFYVHPWEVDSEQPQLTTGTRLSRLRHYVNIERTESKLERLLNSFSFGRVCDIVRAHRESDLEYDLGAPLRTLS